MLLTHIKLFFRSLLRNKKSVFLNILGLSFGLCIFMLIALFVYNELTVDTYYPKSNRLYRVLENNDNAGIDYYLSNTLASEYPEIEKSCPVYQSSEYEFSLESTTNQFKTKLFISTDNQFFELFGIHPIRTNSSSIFPTDDSLVLTASTARKLFGNEDALGQQVKFMGRTLTVSAIIPEFSKRSSLQADFIVNIHHKNNRFHRARINETMVNLHNHYVQVSEGADMKRLTEKVNQNIASKLATVSNLSFQPVKSIYLNPSVKLSRNRAGSVNTIRLFIAIGIVIFLLSIINHLQFSISYHVSNIKSIGMRIFNGASKRNIFQYYLVDTLVLLLISIFFSIALVYLLVPIINPMFSGALNTEFLLTWPFVLLMTITSSFIVCFGAYMPLYVFSKMNLKHLLNKTFTSKQKPFLKGVFPIAQFASAIVLLMCTLTIQKQLSFTKNQDLGFSKQNLLQLDHVNDFKEMDVLKSEIEALSFVESASWSNGAPAFINHYFYDSEAENQEDQIYGIGVDNDFLKTFHISLLSGHSFLSGDLDKACYVNEAFLKAKNWSEPDDYINKKLSGYNIVGVVNDFSTESLHEAVRPTILFHTSTNLNTLNIRITSGQLTDQLAQIKSVWNKVLPGEYFNYKFYDDVFDNMYKREEKLGKAVSLFSLVAFFITAMGLLGLVMQTSISRTKEIGIRKVNGAKVSEILAMLNRDFIKWVIIAFIIATPIAYYAMSKWLENFAYKTTLSWWIFGLAGVLALGIALLTVSWQSWRAATRNPVEALRYE